MNHISVPIVYIQCEITITVWHCLCKLLTHGKNENKVVCLLRLAMVMTEHVHMDAYKPRLVAVNYSN